METFGWILLGSSLGGALAGLIALALGGVGGQWQLRRMLDVHTDAIGELHGRVEREVKRTNVMQRFTKDKTDPLVEKLAEAAAIGSGSTKGPATPAEVLARARATGVIR